MNNNTFQYSLCDCTHTEHMMMSIFCTPCMFGMNQSKLNTLDGEINSSMIPGCVAYTTIGIGWQLIGLLYGDACGASAQIAQAGSSFCGTLGTGLYAASTRRRLRGKYNLEGSMMGDVCLHMWLSPCAVCQEANEIKYRTTVSADQEVAYHKVAIADAY